MSLTTELIVLAAVALLGYMLVRFAQNVGFSLFSSDLQMFPRCSSSESTKLLVDEYDVPRIFLDVPRPLFRCSG